MRIIVNAEELLQGWDKLQNNNDAGNTRKMPGGGMFVKQFFDGRTEAQKYQNLFISFQISDLFFSA